MPRMNLPWLTWSIVRAMSASRFGLRYELQVTSAPSAACSVSAAIAASNAYASKCAECGLAVQREEVVPDPDAVDVECVGRTPRCRASRRRLCSADAAGCRPGTCSLGCASGDVRSGRATRCGAHPRSSRGSLRPPSAGAVAHRRARLASRHRAGSGCPGATASSHGVSRARPGRGRVLRPAA